METRLSCSVDDPARKTLARADRILFVTAGSHDQRFQQLLDFFARFGYSVASLILGRGVEPQNLDPGAEPADLVVVWPDAKELLPPPCWTFFARARGARALWFEPAASASAHSSPAVTVSAYHDGSFLVFSGRELHRAYVELFLTCSCT